MVGGGITPVMLSDMPQQSAPPASLHPVAPYSNGCMHAQAPLYPFAPCSVQHPSAGGSTAACAQMLSLGGASVAVQQQGRAAADMLAAGTPSEGASLEGGRAAGMPAGAIQIPLGGAAPSREGIPSKDSPPEPELDGAIWCTAAAVPLPARNAGCGKRKR